MLARALLVTALLAGSYLLVRWLRRSGGLARFPRWLGAAAALGFLVLLTVRGGGEIAIPLLVALAPFLPRWLQKRAVSGEESVSRPQSAIDTRFLHMTLDHATGVMSGTVREGRFAGRNLQELRPEQLLELWRDCKVDAPSVAVLEAYLDRHVDPRWRDWLEQNERFDQGVAGGSPGPMARAEAYQILGLSEGASRDEIQSAYRRLIQRVHPDQGGSAYLAACLNRARDLLVAESKGK